MGYMRHHALVVTTWGEERMKLAWLKAKELCDSVDEVKLLTEVIESGMNDYRSFALLPDGSKEGWETSNQGDDCRDQLIAWLKVQNYEDGSSAYGWVEIQFCDDNGETKVCRDSDEGRRVNATGD